RAAGSVRTARVAAFVTLGALLVLASSWTHLDAIERGIAVTLVTCAFLVAIETARGGVVQAALSHPTIVYLGRISYGTYLWHWIVILVAIRTFHLGSTTMLIVLLVSTALASLSFQLLEHPVRASTLLDRHRRAVIVTGLDVSVAMNVAHEDTNAIPFLGPHGEHDRNGSPTSVRWLRQTTDESVAKLRADGSKVVLLEPTPDAPIDPLDCLSKSSYLEACRY